nr:uncharacterized protein LOC129135472 isoform X2 [Pan troglodytes]
MCIFNTIHVVLINYIICVTPSEWYVCVYETGQQYSIDMLVSLMIPLCQPSVQSSRPVDERAPHRKLLSTSHLELSVFCRGTVYSSGLSVFIYCVPANGFDTQWLTKTPLRYTKTLLFPVVLVVFVAIVRKIISDMWAVLAKQQTHIRILGGQGLSNKTPV